MYALRDEDLFLIPTAEVPVTNLYRDEMLDGAQPAARLLRVLAVLPTRGGKRRQGHARRASRARVRQGRAGAVCDAGERRPSEHELMTQHATTLLERLGLPYRVKLLAAGDTGFRQREDVRSRDVRARRRRVARGVVEQHVHGLPGAPREHSISARAGREAALRSHAERVGPRVPAHHRVDHRALPAAGRQRHGARGVAAVSRRRLDPLSRAPRRVVHRRRRWSRAAPRVVHRLHAARCRRAAP